ncbi:Hypothetical_protein [Hexamita inflata]|uniref:Hypothetical_protein n=1 Tax=Hexamita inflata TaxID=28002 RepID=A0AA86RA59_9EUKA|nr:Hypothetical protein HINF_LOCUS62314 [Hexamita inflata]
MKRFSSYMQIQKFSKLNPLSIAPKQVSRSELTTPKLATCTIEICRNFNITEIKPLNITENVKLSPAPTLQQVSNIIDETFEFDPNQLKQIFNKFIVNVDIDVNLLECANLIRKSIKSVKINSQRLDELALQITSQFNSIDLLCSKQIAMIQTKIEQ